MKIIFFSLIILILFLNISCSENIFQPDEQFVQILFKYNFKDELNTFENYLTKDLVLDGLIKVNFWMTKEEQNKIQDKVFDTQFFLLPDTILNTAPVDVSPNPVQSLKIKVNSDENSVTWNYIIPEYQTEQYQKLVELSRFIINIIESKPEYKSLPPRNGGYD
jgi:hypothetical protein